MEFDIFEKISDLETKIHFLRLEIVEKDAHIKTLQEQNLVLRKNLESRVPETDQNNSCTSHSTTTKFDKQTSTDPEIEAANAFDQATGQSIADILKETSENVMQTTGYVFDQKTGLYFDKISGYYYDPENQLFFEPRSGVYYSYNSETKEYTYHSRISSELRGQFKRLLSKSSSEQNELSGRQETKRPKDNQGRRRSGSIHRSHRGRDSSSTYSSRRRRSRSSCTRRRYFKHRTSRRHSSSETDLRSLSSSSSHNGDRSRRRLLKHRKRSRSSRSSSFSGGDLAKNRTVEEPASTCLEARPVLYPPSLRLVVLSSTYVKTGTVGIITSTQATSGWGCLGRNQSYCPTFTLIEDVELEEIHCEIMFRQADETYHLKDRKSKSGTYLNGQKLRKNEKKLICHGDVLRIGESRFLIHVHQGAETCSQCEQQEMQDDPQSVPPAAELTDASSSGAIPSSELAVCSESSKSASLSKEALRRSKLDELKVKYGLKGPRSRKPVPTNENYQDRAARRRLAEKLEGSEASAADYAGATSAFRPTPASVFTPIDEQNVGSRLLAKMGWSRGEGLGKAGSGITEPVSPFSH
uniref:Angiogenic factor with G patch and FHA domains 1 n=1 Tax=Schistocephalus solidus TaxID=70667 RepID=A0A0X3NHQ3_SCHSO